MRGSSFSVRLRAAFSLDEGRGVLWVLLLCLPLGALLGFWALAHHHGEVVGRIGLEGELVIHRLDEVLLRESSAFRGADPSEGLPQHRLREAWQDRQQLRSEVGLALLEASGRRLWAEGPQAAGPVPADGPPAGPVQEAFEVREPSLLSGLSWVLTVPSPVVWQRYWSTLLPWLVLLLATGTPLVLAAMFRVLRRARRLHRRDLQSLSRSQARSQVLTEGSGDLITELDPTSGVIRYASPAAHHLGFEPEDLEGRSVLDLVPEEERSEARENLDRLRRSPETLTITHRIVNPAGETRWIEISARSVEDREPLIVAIARDITKRIREERQRDLLRSRLLRSAAAWRQTFDAMETPIVVVDPRGRLQRVNRAAARLAGVDPSELVGRSTRELDHPFWRIFERLAETARRSGQPARGTLRSGPEGQDPGSHHWALVIHPAASLVEESGWQIGIATEITQLVEMRESLRRREALATLGTLFANVAHEVRNPLFSISGLLDAMERRFGQVEGQAQYLSTLRQEVGRLRTIMLGLLEYGRPGTLQPVPSNPVELGREAVESLESKAREASVELELDHPAGLPTISVDPVRMVEVLVNVLDNALSFSPEGQVVTLRIDEVDLHGERHVRYRVRDRGPGFDPDDLEDVFTPFFSRRPGGTGLGLSIVQRLVELHHGKVRIDNAPGGGGEVEIVLPVGAAETSDGDSEAGSGRGQAEGNEGETGGGGGRLGAPFS